MNQQYNYAYQNSNGQEYKYSQVKPSNHIRTPTIYVDQGPFPIPIPVPKPEPTIPVQYKSCQGSTLLYSCEGKEIYVSFTTPYYGAESLKLVSEFSGRPVEFVVFCQDESLDDNVFNQKIVSTGSKVREIVVSIPRTYSKSYYGHCIGHRRDFGLNDNPDLPVIIPILVQGPKKCIYVDPYARGNSNDRIKVTISFY